MAYFSNGTEGSVYEEKYCSRCVHRNGSDGSTGCVVWLAHLIHSYKLCNSECEGKKILDMLIPMKDGFADECSMFHEGEAVPTPEEKAEKARKAVMPGMREWAAKRGLIQ